MPNISNATGATLLVTADEITANQIVDIMGKFALSGEVANNLPAALRLVTGRKFEAIVVDFLLVPHPEIFHRQVRASDSNRTSVMFALTCGSDETAEALKSGFSFALERPLNEESIEHTFKVAFGMIVRERRRYFRFPITVPAVVNTRRPEETIFGQTVNVSERGMGLRTLKPLAPGTELTAEFVLPHSTPLQIRAESKVCWESGGGYSGLSFLFLPGNLGPDLQAWLAQKLEAQLPPDVVRKFSSFS